MTNPYRDQSLRDLIRELAREVGELEGGFTPFFWTRVAPGLGLGSRWYRPLPEANASPADLADAQRALDERLGELRAIQARLPELEAEWLEPPDDVAAVDARASALGRLWALLSVSFDVRGEARALDVLRGSMKRTRLVSKDLPHRRALLEARGLRFSIGWIRNLSMDVETWDLTLATGVARAAGTFAVRSRSSLEAIASEPVRRESSDEFSENYRVVGDADAARFVLSKPLEAALIELTNEVFHPALSIAAPAARLTWNADAKLGLGLDLALDVLRALQATLDGLGLRLAGR
jgi:hypothetical protein